MSDKSLVSPDSNDAALQRQTALSRWDNEGGAGRDLWRLGHASTARHGHSRQADCAGIALAERLRGETDRHDPAGMRRPPDCSWLLNLAATLTCLCRTFTLNWPRTASLSVRSWTSFHTDKGTMCYCGRAAKYLGCVAVLPVVSEREEASVDQCKDYNCRGYAHD